MKRIAIVTGASSGLGRVFVRELNQEALDEIWIIGRKEEKLLALQKEFGEKIVPLCKNLTKDEDIISISDLLKEQSPSVLWLVNNAGIARMAPSAEFSLDEISPS